MPKQHHQFSGVGTEAWRQLGERDEYFFNPTRYLFLVEKAESPSRPTQLGPYAPGCLLLSPIVECVQRF